jgi:3-oxoacyl-[acyl-carrier-protein] synthase II
MRRVVITGMGAITPLGHDVASTWDAAIKGTPGITKITHFDTSGLDFSIAAEVKGFDPSAHFGSKESRRLDRVSQLALVAARQAIDDARLVINDDNSWDIGVVIGCAIGGVNTMLSEHRVMHEKGPRRISPFTVPMMLCDTATGQLAMAFKARGPNLCIVTACASGSNAIGEAFELIRAGRAKAILTGGCESPINAFAMSAFVNMGALSSHNDTPATASRPFDKTRSGFVTGEGAAMFVMEDYEHAKARSAHIHAEIVGYGCTDDAYHITAPDVNGPAMAMKFALRQAGLAPKDVDYLNAHGTSTQLNDANETKAIKTIFGEAAYDLNISSTKSMTGHSFGAAGAVEALMAIKAIQDDVIPPTINYTTPDPDCDLNYTTNTAVRKPVRIAMSNSFGFGGHNGCIVLKAISD